MATSNGEWVPAWHLLEINRRVVEALTDPEQRFLNVQASVRHGKSVMVTVWTVFWFMGVFPGKRVLIVCATSDLAERFSRQVRDLMDEHGPAMFGKAVRQDMRAVDEWGTTDGSVLRAVGVGGLVTGFGFDLIVVDDPVKDADAARSDVQKNKMVEWYSSTLRTRLEPGGTLVLTMARWTEDDLSGTIVERAAELGDSGDKWEIVKMPALAECPRGEDRAKWRDEWGRADGEALWPDRWPAEVLASIRASLLDPQTWDALYQQNPRPRSGNAFDRDNWHLIADPPPNITRKVRAWDLAGSRMKGDWTVGALLGATSDRRTVVLDVRRFRKSASGVEAEIVALADSEPDVAIRLELPKGDSKVTDLHYAKLLYHRDYKGIPVVGNKEARAEQFSAAQQRGLVDVVQRERWTDTYIEELEVFPRGRHDDQVDASSLAFNELWRHGDTAISAMPELVTMEGRLLPELDVQQAPSGW